jgi:coproporphyrinogen III oxidase-like Fe-S oxidoreductase
LPLAASFAAVVPHLGRSQPVPRSIRRTTTTGNDDDDELRVVGYTTTTTTGNNNNNSNNNNIGLYVHIPFCRRRCR